MSDKKKSIYQRPSIVVLEVYEKIIAKGDAHPSTLKRYKELLHRHRKVIL
tara:strand:+ start:546 stop:695 length:150 start_codon:yes stop_codon:yes gene_type:complete